MAIKNLPMCPNLLDHQIRSRRHHPGCARRLSVTPDHIPASPASICYHGGWPTNGGTMNILWLTMCAVSASAVPHTASAQWRTEPAGCAVAMGKADPQAHVRWTGACVDGKVSGDGTLMASNGTMLDGEFREGKPWNAAGREPIVFKSGSETIAQVSFTQGAATSFRTLAVPGGAVPTANTPMLGIWNWHANDGACPEVHEFGASGDARVSSGEERLERFFSLFSTGVQDHYSTGCWRPRLRPMASPTVNSKLPPSTRRSRA